MSDNTVVNTVAVQEVKPAPKAKPKRSANPFTRMHEWLQDHKVWGRPGFKPELNMQEMNFVGLRNTAGNNFAVYVPGFYNFGFSCASGAFSSAATEADLKKGSGNISKDLRAFEKFSKKIDGLKTKLGDSAAKDPKFQKLLSEQAAWKEQIQYMRIAGREYAQYKLHHEYQDLSALKAEADAIDAKKHPSRSKKMKDKAWKAEGKFKRLAEEYQAMMIRELGVVEATKQSILEIRMSNNELPTLNADKAAVYAIRPGVFVNAKVAENAFVQMLRQLRGIHLPTAALKQPPANPSHLKMRDHIKDQAQMFRAKDLQSSNYYWHIHARIDKETHKYSAADRILPWVAFAAGLAFTFVTTALLVTFIASVFTPLGAPFWAIMLMASAIFAVDLLCNNDDWKMRAKRLAAPIQRLFSGTIFNPNGFSYRTTERFSALRAVITGTMLLFLGFNLTIGAIGSAESLKEAWQAQSNLSKFHPVALIVLVTLFALASINSRLHPISAEYFGRVGLFFFGPSKYHQVDVKKEVQALLQHPAFLKSSKAADQAAAKAAIDQKAMDETLKIESRDGLVLAPSMEDEAILVAQRPVVLSDQQLEGTAAVNENAVQNPTPALDNQVEKLRLAAR